MDAKEAIAKIKSVSKYYLYAKGTDGKPEPMEQSVASRMCTAIVAGTCKPETERKFLSAFGFEVSQEVQYKQVRKIS